MQSAIFLKHRLRQNGIRPTEQRTGLAKLLFEGPGRHITAAQLHEEAVRSGMKLTVATIYNTLHSFTQAGLVRAVAGNGTKTVFDTSTDDHHHFLIEETGEIVNIMDGLLAVTNIPVPPDGYEIQNIDVIVRVRRCQRKM